MLRRCFPITRGAQNLTFFLQLTPSSEKKSIPELKTQLAVRPVLDSLLASANGCICGGILGANAMMVSSASTLSLMHEVTLQCLDLNSPHLGVFTFVPAGSPTVSLSSLTDYRPPLPCFWRVLAAGTLSLLSIQFFFGYPPSPVLRRFFSPFVSRPFPPSLLFSNVLFVVLMWTSVNGDTMCGGLERFVTVEVDGGSSALPD